MFLPWILYKKVRRLTLTQKRQPTQGAQPQRLFSGTDGFSFVLKFEWVDKNQTRLWARQFVSPALVYTQQMNFICSLSKRAVFFLLSGKSSEKPAYLCHTFPHDTVIACTTLEFNTKFIKLWTARNNLGVKRNKVVRLIDTFNSVNRYFKQFTNLKVRCSSPTCSY